MKLPTQRYSQDLRRYYRLPAVQVSLTLVLSLFVMAGFIFFALRPTIVSIVTLRNTITESEEKLAKLDTKVKNLQQASAQLEAVKPLLPAVNLTIPTTGAEYPPLTLAVSFLAAQNGVQLQSESMGATMLFSRILAPFNPSITQSVISLPFSLRVTGTYPSVANFLSQILTMERIVMVESISLTKEAATRTTTPTVSLNINGSAYYLADEAQLIKAMPDFKGTK
jgi:Tfp pilus assembly protein PilO